MDEELLKCLDIVQRLTRVETSLKEFRIANDERMEKLNDLRSDVEKDRNQFMKVGEYQIQRQTLIDRVDELRNWQSWVLGVGSLAVIISGLLGAILEFYFRGGK
jgi:hypothetical protein